MTRITTTPLAVSADYHDALVAARRAKSWLFLLLLLGILAQITVFFLAKFEVLKIGPGGEASMSMSTKVHTSSTTAPTTSTTTSTGEDTTTTTHVVDTSVTVEKKTVSGGPVAWVINSTVYLASVLSIVLSCVVLLIVLIMLVGRLIGVSHATSAYVWAAFLAVLLFPWQLFYSAETAKPIPALASASAIEKPAPQIDVNDYRIPGALYTWGELTQGVQLDGAQTQVKVLRYARFVGFPLLALIVLLIVKAKSGRGMKLALGETEVHVDVTTTET
jgi:hypothetical protein